MSPFNQVKNVSIGHCNNMICSFSSKTCSTNFVLRDKMCVWVSIPPTLRYSPLISVNPIIQTAFYIHANTQVLVDEMALEISGPRKQD